MIQQAWRSRKLDKTKETTLLQKSPPAKNHFTEKEAKNSTQQAALASDIEASDLDQDELSNQEEISYDSTKQHPEATSSLNGQQARSPSNGQLKTMYEEIELLKSSLADVEARSARAEFRTKEMRDKLSQTIRQSTADLEAKNAKIANLQSLIQTITAENRSLIDSSLSIKQDLLVYRKIAQLKTAQDELGNESEASVQESDAPSTENAPAMRHHKSAGKLGDLKN